MSGLFKSKTERHEPEVKVVADPYAGIRKSLQSYLTSQMGGPGPKYTGEMVAPLSEFEKMSEEPLRKYAGGKLPGVFTAGREEISKTLEGAYDPAASPYYQAVKAEAARNLAETHKDIASRAAGGGRYYTGARVGEQAEASTDVTNYLNKVLGDIAERERERKLQAVPIAQMLAEFEEAEPLRKVSALQTYGALPRTQQQAYLDAVRSEWEKSTRDWPLSIAGLSAGVQQAPLYSQYGYTQTPSIFSQIYEPIAGAAGQAVGTAMGMGASNYFFPTKTKTLPKK